MSITQTATSNEATASRLLSGREMLVVAVWCAVPFGFLEGVLLDVAIFFPKLLAPYKASFHQLYVAPVVNVLFFIGAVPALALGLRLSRRWTQRHQPRLVFCAFVFMGAVTVLVTLRLLYWWAVGAVAVGVTVAFARAAAGREADLVAWLRGHLILLPASVAVAAVGVAVWGFMLEFLRIATLPQVTGLP